MITWKEMLHDFKLAHPENQEPVASVVQQWLAQRSKQLGRVSFLLLQHNALLKKLEWHDGFCPACGNGKPQGHFEHCELLKLLSDYEAI